MSRQNRQQLRTPGLGKGELEVLHFVHARAPVTVREVADHLARERGIVRTTVLNVMARLVDKGFLTRKRVEGVYQYVPRTPQATLLRSLVRDFVKGALGGSVSPFVAYLVQEAKEGGVTEAELAELKRLVNDLDQRKDAP
jgi:predicted transcriptional regulator